ncbi:MAG: hypothetical protein KF884_08975 [Fimbriimonadaceae bacterium]|nr:hypothetical protein [Fimbriimonadaceae bacterium]QYK57682.1 MAG: hypothetical protein KF884_08975 [Fimbriimonadaceae bacterium]
MIKPIRDLLAPFVISILLTVFSQSVVGFLTNLVVGATTVILSNAVSQRIAPNKKEPKTTLLAALLAGLAWGGVVLVVGLMLGPSGIPTNLVPLVALGAGILGGTYVAVGRLLEWAVHRFWGKAKFAQ